MKFYTYVARYRSGIFLAMAFVILLGSFVGLGSYWFTSRDVSESIAVVGGEKLSRNLYDTQVRRILDRMKDRKQEPTAAAEAELKQEVLRDMVVESLLAREARRIGMRVTDREVSADVAATFQRDGAFDQGLYFHTVETQFRMSPEEYESMRRKSILSLKFRELIARSIKVTPEEGEAEYKREKGSLKGWDKEQNAYLTRIQQRRSVDALNFILRRLASTIDIKTYPGKDN